MLCKLVLVVTLLHAVSIFSSPTTKILVGTMEARSRLLGRLGPTMAQVHQLGVIDDVWARSNVFSFERIFFDTALNDGKFYATYSNPGIVTLPSMGVICPQNLGDLCEQTINDGGRGVRRMLPYILANHNNFFSNEINNTEAKNPVSDVSLKIIENFGTTGAFASLDDLLPFLTHVFLPAVACYSDAPAQNFPYFFKLAPTEEDIFSEQLNVLTNLGLAKFIVPSHIVNLRQVKLLEKMATPNVLIDGSYQVYEYCPPLDTTCGNNSPNGNSTARWIEWYRFSREVLWRVYINVLNDFGQYLGMQDAFEHSLARPYIIWSWSLHTCTTPDQFPVQKVLKTWASSLPPPVVDFLMGLGDDFTWVRYYENVIFVGMICQKKQMSFDPAEENNFQKFWMNLTWAATDNVGKREGFYWQTVLDAGPAGDWQFWEPGLVPSDTCTTFRNLAAFDGVDAIRTDERAMLDVGRVMFDAFDGLIGKQLDAQEMHSVAVKKQILTLSFDGFSGIVKFKPEGDRLAGAGTGLIFNLQDNHNPQDWVIINSCGPLNLTWAESKTNLYQARCSMFSGVLPFKLVQVGSTVNGTITLTKRIQWPDNKTNFNDTFDECEPGKFYNGFAPLKVWNAHQAVKVGNGSKADLKPESEKFCQSCSPGKFQDSRSEDLDCKKCGGAGLYSAKNGSKTCSECDAGKFQYVVGASACFDCDPGFFSVSGSDKCTICSSGRFSKRAADTCENCKVGSFSSKNGTEMCTACPDRQTTLESGAKFPTECGCPAEFYLIDSPAQQVCAVCPNGMACEFGSREQNIKSRMGSYPKVQPGFYTEPSIPLSVYTCFSDQAACPGGLPGTCSTGRSGLVCQTCPNKHFRTGGGCEECTSQIIALFFCLLLYVVVLIVLHKATNKQVLHTSTSVMNVAAFVFSVLLTTAQLFGLLDSLDFNFGEGNSAVAVFDVFMFSPAVLRLECIAEGSNVQYLLQAIFFPCTALGFLGVSIISRAIPKHRVDVRAAINSVLTVNQGLLITFSSMSLSAFQCFTHDNGVQTMYTFANVICWEGDHFQFVVLSVIMLLTVIVPFKCVFFCAILRLYLHRRSPEKSLEILISFKLFFQRWRAECWFWGFVFGLRQLLLSMTLIVSDDAYMQMVFVLSILSVYTVAEAMLRPWRVLEMNVIEFVFMQLIVLLLVCRSASSTTESDDVFDFWFKFLLVVALCVGVLCIARICVAAVATGVREFVGVVKPVPTQSMVESIGMLTDVSDNDAFAEMLKGLGEHDKLIVSQCLRILKIASCGGLAFPMDVGARVYIPSQAMVNQENKSDFLKRLQSKTKESYI